MISYDIPDITNTNHVEIRNLDSLMAHHASIQPKTCGCLSKYQASSTPLGPRTCFPQALKAHGLDEWSYVYGFDEVPSNCEPVLRRVFGAVKRAFPGLKTMAAINWPKAGDWRYPKSFRSAPFSWEKIGWFWALGGNPVFKPRFGGVFLLRFRLGPLAIQKGSHIWDVFRAETIRSEPNCSSFRFPRVFKSFWMPPSLRVQGVKVAYPVSICWSLHVFSYSHVESDSWHLMNSLNQLQWLHHVIIIPTKLHLMFRTHRNLPSIDNEPR